MRIRLDRNPWRPNATPLNGNTAAQWMKDRPHALHMAALCGPQAHTMSNEDFILFAENVAAPRLTDSRNMNALTVPEAQRAFNDLVAEVERRRDELRRTVTGGRALTESKQTTDFLRRLGDLGRLTRDELEDLVNELNKMLTSRQTQDLKTAAHQFPAADLAKILKKVESALDQRRQEPQTTESTPDHPAGWVFMGPATVDGHRARQYRDRDGSIISLFED
jgi:hypothetical protein